MKIRFKWPRGWTQIGQMADPPKEQPKCSCEEEIATLRRRLEALEGARRRDGAGRLQATV